MNNNNNFKNNNKSVKEWLRTLKVYPFLTMIIFLILLSLSLKYFFSKSYKKPNINI